MMNVDDIGVLQNLDESTKHVDCTIYNGDLAEILEILHQGDRQGTHKCLDPRGGYIVYVPVRHIRLGIGVHQIRPIDDPDAETEMEDETLTVEV